MTCASDAAQPFVIATKGQVMARPPQINFEVDTAFEKEINAVITKSGMKRTDYYRMISRAFVDADADGRPFLANTPAIDQIRFAELFYKLDAFTIETERLQKDNAKRQAKIQKTTSEDELAIAHAQRDAARAITSSIVAELTPLRDELEQLARSANRPSWLPDVHKSSTPRSRCRNGRACKRAIRFKAGTCRGGAGQSLDLAHGLRALRRSCCSPRSFRNGLSRSLPPTPC